MLERILHDQRALLEGDASRVFTGTTQLSTQLVVAVLLLCELQSLMLHRLSFTNLDSNNGKVSDIGIRSILSLTKQTNHPY